MKTKSVLFGILLVLTVCELVSVPATASTSSYRYLIDYATELDRTDGGGSSWGTLSLASGGGTDGWDGEQVCPWANDPTAVVVGLYNISGVNGWNSSTGFYYADWRRDVLSGQTRVFDNIYVWAGLSADGYRMGFVQYGDTLSPGLNYKLSLISVPAGISYSGPWQWGFGSDSSPTKIYLPMYRTDDGTTGYRFRVELSTVPEPSSLLALAGGLAGIGGLFLRVKR